MEKNLKTVLALDIDGVLNHFSKTSKPKSINTQIEGYDINVRADILERVKALLERPEVTGAWLTTWLDAPESLAKFIAFTGLDEHYVPLFFESPLVQTGWGGTARSEAFAGTSSNPANFGWWKYRSLELFEAKHKPERLAFLDDDLFRISGKGAPSKRPTYERFFLKPYSVAGLVHDDLDKLEAWLALPEGEELS